MSADGLPWGVESEGIPPAVTGQVVVTRYNDPEALA